MDHQSENVLVSVLNRIFHAIRGVCLAIFYAITLPGMIWFNGRLGIRRLTYFALGMHLLFGGLIGSIGSLEKGFQNFVKSPLIAVWFFMMAGGIVLYNIFFTKRFLRMRKEVETLMGSEGWHSHSVGISNPLFGEDNFFNRVVLQPLAALIVGLILTPIFGSGGAAMATAAPIMCIGAIFNYCMWYDQVLDWKDSAVTARYMEAAIAGTNVADTGGFSTSGMVVDPAVDPRIGPAFAQDFQKRSDSLGDERGFSRGGDLK